LAGGPDLAAIADDDISVVIQGPLLLERAEGVARCLESVRAVLPGAEVIVSTWEGEDTGRIGPPVRIVQSPDPGAFAVRDEPPYNLNRLLLSTQAGLLLARRRYCLKFRTDLALTDRRFLVVAARRPGCLFERPVTMSNLYIRDPEKFPLLFHFSDIAQFGLTRDLQSFWSGGPFVEEDVLFPPERPGGEYIRTRLYPEQAMTLRWLQRNGVAIALRRPAEIDRTLLEAWAQVLARNVHIVNWQQSGIVFPEKFSSNPASDATVLTAEKAAALGSRGFSYRRARINAIVLNGLLHGTLATCVARLRARSPLASRALRWLWAWYHKLTG
jgi:hypothetical protein